MGTPEKVPLILGNPHLKLRLSLGFRFQGVVRVTVQGLIRALDLKLRPLGFEV